MLSKKLILITIATLFSSLSLVAMQPEEECEKVDKKGPRSSLFFCTKKPNIKGLGNWYVFNLLATNPQEANTFYTPKIGTSIAQCDDQSCELYTLSIDPSLQNRGWGSWLLKKTLSYLTLNNYKEITLTAEPIQKTVWYQSQIKQEHKQLEKANATDCKDYARQLVWFIGKDIEATENKLLRFYRKNGGQKPPEDFCKETSFCHKFFVFPLNQSK